MEIEYFMTRNSNSYAMICPEEIRLQVEVRVSLIDGK
jgi:hypothetical protein